MEFIKDLVEKNSYFYLKEIKENKISFESKYFDLTDLDHAYELKKIIKTNYPELKVKIYNDFNRVLITINYEDKI